MTPIEITTAEAQDHHQADERVMLPAILKSLTFPRLTALLIAVTSGIFDAQGQTMQGDLKNLPRSSDVTLGLSIMGTIVKGATGAGVALIKEAATGTVKAVKAGNQILGKAYLVKEVHGKYIVVTKLDGSRLLIFQDKFSREFSGNQIAADPAPRTSQAGNDVYREEGFERIKDQVKISATYRDRLINQDLAKILMQATAEPATENGIIVGFKFSQIDPESIYAKSGLRDEDVVTGINGQKLNSVGEAVTLLKSLRQADQVEIELKRGGSPARIQIDVKP
ncbi:MAG: ral secretion pathway protein GspC [Pseudomonadota bacterium]|jgi:type II secretory pathway component PulC